MAPGLKTEATCFGSVQEVLEVENLAVGQNRNARGAATEHLVHITEDPPTLGGVSVLPEKLVGHLP